MSRSRIAIVTDSTAGLPQDGPEPYDIRVIPQYLTWGEQKYLDGVTLDPPTFYRRLASNGNIPTTCQPSVEDFRSFFAEAAYGVEAVVGIFISADLSATVNAARAARDMLPDIPIRIVDSRSTCMGLGFMAREAARAAQVGRCLDEVALAAGRLAPRMNVLFMVETLEYLHRGGRIGNAAAWLGSELRIRPILHLEDGRIAAVTRVRTRSQAIERLLDLLGARLAGARDIRAAVFHADAPQEAARLRERVRTRFDCAELLTAQLSPALATHLGPGTIGIAAYQDSCLELSAPISAPGISRR